MAASNVKLAHYQLDSVAHPGSCHEPPLPASPPHRPPSPRPSALLAACGGGGSSSSPSPSDPGVMRIALTDAPACGYDEVNVTVEKVRVHRSSRPTTATAAGPRWC